MCESHANLMRAFLCASTKPAQQQRRLQTSEQRRDACAADGASQGGAVAERCSCVEQSGSQPCSLRHRPRRGSGPAASPKPAGALDAAAVKSRLVVLRVKDDKGTRQVVVLGKPAGAAEIPDNGPACRLDMLPRELVRQAVLIAARDELGLATRDQVIDETPVTAKSRRPIRSRSSHSSATAGRGSRSGASARRRSRHCSLTRRPSLPAETSS